jgi:hypothetical protein
MYRYRYAGKHREEREVRGGQVDISVLVRCSGGGGGYNVLHEVRVAATREKA